MMHDYLMTSNAVRSKITQEKISKVTNLSTQVIVLKNMMGMLELEIPQQFLRNLVSIIAQIIVSNPINLQKSTTEKLFILIASSSKVNKRI